MENIWRRKMTPVVVVVFNAGDCGLQYNPKEWLKANHVVTALLLLDQQEEADRSTGSQTTHIYLDRDRAHHTERVTESACISKGRTTNLFLRENLRAGA